MNKKLAFISRHVPTNDQVALAADQGFDLVHVGDADAFTVNSRFVCGKANDLDIVFDGVVVVHPAAAMNLCSDFLIGVFNNANRAAPGQPVSFSAVSFHVFDHRKKVK